MSKLAMIAISFFVMVASNVVQASPVFGQGTWETTMLGRDINGNAVAANSSNAVFFYDTDLNITWLRNFTMTGASNWFAQSNWASGLSVGGFSDWRLPVMTDTGAPGCNGGFSGTDCGYNVDTSNNEMAHLFQVTLGNKPNADTSGNYYQTGWGLTNTGYFENLWPGSYWFDTAYALDPSLRWYLDPNWGYQVYGATNRNQWATAVRDGDVLSSNSNVPEPASLALLGLGLAGLGFSRRRKTKLAA